MQRVARDYSRDEPHIPAGEEKPQPPMPETGEALVYLREHLSHLLHQQTTETTKLLRKIVEILGRQEKGKRWGFKAPGAATAAGRAEIEYRVPIGSDLFVTRLAVTGAGTLTVYDGNEAPENMKDVTSTWPNVSYQEDGIRITGGSTLRLVWTGAGAGTAVSVNAEGYFDTE